MTTTSLPHFTSIHCSHCCTPLYMHLSPSPCTTQLTEAPPDSPHSSKRFACAFSSAALKACSSAPHVAPLPPRHIQRRPNRVSSTFPMCCSNCFCTVSFGMERKVQKALQLSPTLGVIHLVWTGGSLREGGTTHDAHELMPSAHWSRVLTPQAHTHESGTTTAQPMCTEQTFNSC